MGKRKPWRKFKEKKRKDKHIRRVCMVLLAVEILALKARGVLRIPGVKVSAGQSEVVIYRPLGEGESLPGERIYGIRIRLKDGVVDFYRREEILEQDR